MGRYYMVRCGCWCVYIIIVLCLSYASIFGFIKFFSWANSLYDKETISVVIPNPITDSISVDSVRNYEVMMESVGVGGGIGVGVGLPQIVLKSVKEFEELIPSDARVYTYIKNKHWYVERHYSVIAHTTVFSTSIIVKCPGLRKFWSGFVKSYNNESVTFEYFIREKKGE